MLSLRISSYGSLHARSLEKRSFVLFVLYFDIILLNTMRELSYFILNIYLSLYWFVFFQYLIYHVQEVQHGDISYGFIYKPHTKAAQVLITSSIVCDQ